MSTCFDLAGTLPVGTLTAGTPPTGGIPPGALPAPPPTATGLEVSALSPLHHWPNCDGSFPYSVSVITALSVTWLTRTWSFNSGDHAP